MRPAWIEISLPALRHNTAAFRKVLRERSEIMGIIKANAYGHGAIKIADTLKQEGIHRFGVALVQEGIELRENGVTDPILILGYTPEEDFTNLLRYNLTPTLYATEQAIHLDRHAREMGKIACAHLKIDTGMGRIGYLPEPESIEKIKQITALPNLDFEGIFSHQAWADAPDDTVAARQFERFEKFLDRLEQAGLRFKLTHIANSATTINYPHMHLDLVRVGISLYGLFPDARMAIHPKIDLKPVMRVKAKLVHIKEVPEGTPISYGCTFTTPRKSIIGTIPMGYADGIPRALSSKGEVLVRGRRCPIAGRICMDQFMVDLTDLRGGKIGDEVVFLGAQEKARITADEIAEKAGTIAYEIVTRMSPRLPRLYIDK